MHGTPDNKVPACTMPKPPSNIVVSKLKLAAIPFGFLLISGGRTKINNKIAETPPAHMYDKWNKLTDMRKVPARNNTTKI